MAVFMKNSNFSFLANIGVKQELIDQLKAGDFCLAIGFYDLKFQKDGKDVAQLKLSKTTNDLAKKVVGPSILQQILHDIEYTIQQVLKLEGPDKDPKNSGEPEQGLLDILNQMPGNKEMVTITTTTGKGPQYTYHTPATSKEILDELDNGGFSPPNMVHLRDATAMYQPVRGTDPHSVYRVIAMSDDINVAVKMQGGGFSVRVEGKGFGDDLLHENLEKLGISVKGQYASGHFENPGHVPMARTIAALLASMGVNFVTPIPNMKAVAKAFGVAA